MKTKITPSITTSSVIPAKAGIQKTPTSKKSGSENIIKSSQDGKSIPQTKQTEIGRIPEYWTFYPFQNCIKKLTISRLNQIPKSSYLKIGQFPIIDQGKEFIAGWTNDEFRLYKNNLPVIIFGDHTRCFKYVEKPFVIGADGVKIIKPNEKFNTQFFYYFLLNTKIPDKGYNRHYKLVKELSIPLPPLEEQKKIAGVLSQIQKAIEIQNQLIEKTKELKKSTMKHLFTYGTKQSNHTFKSTSSVESVIPASSVIPAKAGIQNSPTSKKLDTENKPHSSQNNIYWPCFKNPVFYLDSRFRGNDSIHENLNKTSINKSPNNTWPLVKLEDIAQIISGQSPKGMYLNKNCEGLPFYQGKTEFTNIYIGKPKVWTNKVTKIAEKDDILISVRAPVGPVNIATQKICIGRGLATIRSKKVDQLFLFQYLISIRNRIKGSGGTIFDSISRDQLKVIKILLPPIEEQKEIAGILQTLDQKIEHHENKKSTLEELFKSMLNKLMTGQIRVHKLDIKIKEI